jgi:hypothetical protein
MTTLSEDAVARKPSWRNALGVALIVEAFISPIAWLGTFSANNFVAVGDGSMTQRLADLMRRAGSLGPLVLFVVLIGAAVIVLAHPVPDGWPPATICFVAAACNLLPALWFLGFNAVVSTGPASTRVAGITFGALPMALVATGLIIEGTRSAKAGGERTAATSQAPM